MEREQNAMDKEIDISFCLPCFNVKPFIWDCLESLLDQEYDKNRVKFEIVCVDDCSTDGTYEYLENCKKKIPQLRVIQNNTNKGVSYTRNKLIMEAKGKYIWFIDPDDALYRGGVIKVLKEIRRVNGDGLFCNFTKVPESFLYSKEKKDFVNDESVLVSDKSRLPTDGCRTKMSALGACVWLREFLVVNNIRFNERMRLQEVAVFWWQIMMCTDKIYYIKSPIFYYRQRGSSLSHLGSKKKRETFNECLEKLLLYQSYLHIKDKKVKKILRKKIFLTKQGILSCLVTFDDKREIKEKMQELKQKKIYPYKLSFYAFSGRENILKKLLRFLFPIKPFFWLTHWIYNKRKLKV